MHFLNPPLVPRNGHILEVVGVARISTLNQDERSLADQEALLRSWLKRHFAGSFNLRMIASQASGERLDREESVLLNQAVESRKIDLVLTEDLGRIFRRMHAYLFCEHCEDYKTRLVAINDHVDTAQANWQMAAIFSAIKHQQFNEETSQRIKRTHRHRFTQGGVFQTTIFGYQKPPDAKCDADVTKDPSAEPIYDEWFTRLEAGATYSEVADWLNSLGVPVGPYSRDKQWNGRMVRRITMNPILKGERQRNNKKTELVYETGRRKSVDASPEELLSRFCPHLAFIERERYDRVVRMLRARNEQYARGRQAAMDCRKDVPRKRTVWPGQHVVCGVCGRLFYWGGHGQQEHMMCSGNRDYRCWNGVTFDGRKAAAILSKAILDEIEALPGFDSVLLEKVRSQWETQKSARTKELAMLSSEMQTVCVQIERVTEAIAQVGGSQALHEKLVSLESKRDGLRVRQDDLQRELPEEFPLPPVEEIKRLARELLATHVAGLPDFNRIIKRLVPSLRVHPYRLCDGGHLVLRATLTIDLTALVAVDSTWGNWGGVLRRHRTVDLFEAPQREAFRKQIMALRRCGLTERQIATKLGLTITAVQRAAALQRAMDAQKLTDPYIPVTEPPLDCTKMRRHLHPRYRFERLGEGELS
jgi:DNA invertase Pin-like site-specific DNA recombinase